MENKFNYFLTVWKKKRYKNSDRKQIDEKILTLLQQGDLELQELIHLTEEERECVVERVRNLLELGKIAYKSPTLLCLNVL